MTLPQVYREGMAGVNTRRKEEGYHFSGSAVKTVAADAELR